MSSVIIRSEWTWLDLGSSNKKPSRNQAESFHISEVPFLEKLSLRSEYQNSQVNNSCGVSFVTNFMIVVSFGDDEISVKITQ